MNWNHVAKLILITGKKGTGKTTLFLNYWKTSKARYKFAFDPDQEITRKCRLQPAMSIAQCVHFLKHKYPVCYDPREEFPGNYDEAFAIFCRWLYEVCKVLNGVKEFYCDEIQKRTRTGIGGVNRALIEIVDAGRREEIDCIFVVNKGLNKLSDDIRAHLTKIHAFQTTDTKPLQWLEEQEFDVEKIKLLKVGQFQTRDI